LARSLEKVPFVHMESLHLRFANRTMESGFSRPTFLSSAIRFLPRFGNVRARLIFESTLLALAVFLSAIWYSAPYFVRDYINRGLAGLPDYTGRVEWVRIHPWSASWDLYNVHLEKRTGEIPVHFFYSPRWNISLQWSQIFHGVERGSVTIFDPQINLVSGPNSEQSQISISKVWIDAIKQMIPWRVNQIRIHRGDIHFLDFHANPRVDLEMNQLEVAVENISNSKGLKVPLPATVTINACPLLTGTFEMNLAVNFDEQFATFTQNFHMEHVPAVGANSLLEKYFKVRVMSGEIGLYSELNSDKGIYRGYVKPFFYHLEFEPKPDDEGNPGAIWSGLLNTVKGLFENDKQVIATQSEISGRVDQPNVDTLSAVVGILRNAYIEALRPGFDPAHAPPKPTDTITTPSSASTEKEAALPSPAAKNK
jgi:Domain of Unknown Function (DUF748)